MTTEKDSRVGVVSFHEKIATRLEGEINSLEDAGYDITVFNWDKKGVFQSLADDLDFEIERISLRAPEGITSIPFLPIYYAKLYRRIQNEDFDTIHCADILMLPICILIGRNKNIVYDQREMYSKWLISFHITTIERILVFLFNFFEGQMVKHVDYVLTVDSVDDSLIRRYEKYNENVDVLFNAPSVEFDVDQSRVQELKEEYPEEHLLAHVGNIDEKKGLREALTAVNILKVDFDLKLLLIGQVRMSDEQLSSILSDLDIQDQVEVIDWVPHDEMKCYLEIVDIGLALYQDSEKYECLSKGNVRKIPTYMNASVPVIAPSFGEIGMLVEENDCGLLVDSSDPEEIAEGISEILCNPTMAARMGENGRAVIEEEYNWEVEKEKLLSAYDSLT